MSLETVTNNFDNQLNNIDNQVDNYLGVLKNESAVVCINLFLILYAAIIAPNLPNSILKWFHNWIVQLALFFVVVYISSKNFTVAIAAAIAVLVTIMTANSRATLKKAIAFSAVEKFAQCGCSKSDSRGRYRSGNTDDIDNGYDHDYDHDESAKALFAAGASDNSNPWPSKIFPVHRKIHSNHIDGILEDHMENYDNRTAGMAHAVMEGAITSENAPMIDTETEDKFDIDNELEYIRQNSSSVSGVEEQTAENESIGFSLDETMPMGEENASVQEIKAIPAKDFIMSAIAQVTNKIKEETGLNVSEEKQEEIAQEATEKIATMAKKRRVGEYDVYKICREIYRKKL